MVWEQAEKAFTAELQRLTANFSKNLALYRSPGYDEAAVRVDFLNPFFAALGWDLENRTGVAQSLRDVQIETRVSIGGKKKKADYLFRTNGIERFVFEAKAPNVTLTKKEAYQAQRYAFNLSLRPALLGNFETLQFFVVGGKPESRAPWDICLQWHFSEYAKKAKEIWELFSRESVGNLALDHYIDALPKRAIRGTERQGWLIKRERIRTVDKEFLAYIEELREELARDLFKENPGYEWNETNLNECVQRIIDRLLFVRICEDRDIDTGQPLENILRDWEASSGVGRPSLYSKVTAHFNRLDETFNGTLFAAGHESEALNVSDHLFAGVIQHLSSEDSDYLFSTLPVEILGAVYEQFIGKVIQIKKGRKIEAELKPELKKAGGVYYTPRYVVNYIVEETVGKQVDGKSPKEVSKLHFVDPSCGSGSFLIRVFERIVEHHVSWFEAHPKEQSEKLCFRDDSGTLNLTTHLKRRIVANNIFGVDTDYRAVEVTMLSLYLKILENETRISMGWQHNLFPSETFLPDLSNNIKCGNSLVGSDFFSESLLGLMEVDGGKINAFDWSQEFDNIIKSKRTGGFDAVVGNPPYIRIQTLKQIDPDQLSYFARHYRSAAQGNYDIYVVFVEKGLSLLSKTGSMGYILPNKFLTTDYGAALRGLLAEKKAVSKVVDFGHAQVFDGVSTFTNLLFLTSAQNETVAAARVDDPPTINEKALAFRQYPALELSSGSWLFESPEEDSVRRKMVERSTPLLELPCLISRGSSTGMDDVFMVSKVGSRYKTRDGDEVELEKEILRKPIYATDFNRYAFNPTNREFVIFPYTVDDAGYTLIPQRTLSETFPKAYEYLSSRRRALKKRKQFAAWYSFSAPRNLDTHEHAQMFVPLLADRGLLCEISGKQSAYCLMASGGFSISVLPESGLSHYYVLGLLNSELMFWYLRGISNKFRGGWVTCTKQYMGILPIRNIDRASKEDSGLYKSIVKHVKVLVGVKSKLIALKSESQRVRYERQVQRLESAVNSLVYQLYSVSDSEVEAIELELASIRTAPEDRGPSQEEIEWVD